MPLQINQDVEEHKEENVYSDKNLAFAERIRRERAAEKAAFEARVQKEIDMGQVKGKKSIDKIFDENMKLNVQEARKQSKKKAIKKPRKKRVKKEKKLVKKVLTEEEIVEKRKTQYSCKIKVDKFNQFKVDYIQRRIHFENDAKKKAIYVQALTKYDV